MLLPSLLLIFSLASDPGARAPISLPSPLPEQQLDGRDSAEQFLREYLATAAAPAPATSVHIETDFARTGHYARPDTLVKGAWARTVTAHAGQPAWQFDWSERRSDVEGRGPFEVSVRGDGVFGDAKLSRRDALQLHIAVRAPFPALLTRYVVDHGVLVGFSPKPTESGPRVLTFEIGDGRVELHFQSTDGGPRLAVVQLLTHDTLLGDALERLEYGEEKISSGVAQSWKLNAPLGAWETSRVLRAPDTAGSSEPVDPPVARADRAAIVLLDPESTPGAIRAVALGDGLWELLVAAHDARSIALELEDGWAVLEAPVSSSVGESMIAVLEKLRSGLPLRYVAASHHHPHYIGAMRPFVARGAAVVCPAGVRDYVLGILNRPRTLRPDALARGAREPVVIGVTSGVHWSPPGAAEQLVVVEAAGRSSHTDAFELFILPSAKLAFGGDLLWMPISGEARRRSPRTIGLGAMLTDVGDIEIASVLTSWPVISKEGGEARWRDTVTLDDLRAYCAEKRPSKSK